VLRAKINGGLEEFPRSFPAQPDQVIWISWGTPHLLGIGSLAGIGKKLENLGIDDPFRVIFPHVGVERLPKVAIVRNNLKEPTTFRKKMNPFSLISCMMQKEAYMSNLLHDRPLQVREGQSSIILHQQTSGKVGDAGNSPVSSFCRGTQKLDSRNSRKDLKKVCWGGIIQTLSFKNVCLGAACRKATKMGIAKNNGIVFHLLIIEMLNKRLIFIALTAFVLSACMSKAEIEKQQDCENSDGIYRTSEAMGSRCFLPMLDSGNPCSSSKYCNGFCQAPQNAKRGTNTSGNCSKWKDATCKREVRNGIVQSTWCY